MASVHVLLGIESRSLNMVEKCHPLWTIATVQEMFHYCGGCLLTQFFGTTSVYRNRKTTWGMVAMCFKPFSLLDARHHRHLDVCIVTTFSVFHFMLSCLGFHDISYCECSKAYAKIYNVKTLLVFSIPILH